MAPQPWYQRAFAPIAIYFSGSCNLLRFILITSLAHGLRLSDSGKII